MAPRTSRSLASAAPDPQIHEPTDDGMSLDVPEQLLTPENSRSETSSNNETALADEKPAGRRRSTRVARASLRPGEPLDDTPEKEEPAASSSEAYVDSLAKAKRSHSSLRHSIAVMENSMWTPDNEEAAADDHPMAPDTPVSKSSQDIPSEDMNTSLQQRTLRNRVEKALAEDEQKPAKATPSRTASRKSLRRSGRIGLLDKATDIVERASSILGKRTRGLLDKEPGRRASLRPRNIAPSAEETKEPVPKKRRVSESDLSKLVKEAEPEESSAPVPASPRPKRKIWLSHGLYTGQQPSDSPPKQRRSKNSKKTGTGPMQRTVLPMPMFKGARLLKNGRDYQLPFDIFSPLPLGQPKPDEWRKTNKNVFVGDAGSFWKANKNLELSLCMCEEDTGCDENCQNRYMFYECDNGNCRLGPECGNRNFEGLKHRTKAGGKYNIGVEVIKTADRGYGVRSNRSFEPNQIIVEYTGEILTQLECEKRMRSVYKNNDCYYLMYFDQNMIIDATRGSIARFVNHACEPNCRMEKWTVAGKPRMALFAGDRGVSTGEELSYDYNFDPYSNKNVQQCRCGSANCRGFLGPRLKDKQQRAKELEKRKAEESPKKSNGKKRKASESDSDSSDSDSDSDVPVQPKKRKITAKSIKAGVKKAVATVRGKKITKKTTTAKTTVKLPAVKTTGRVKAARAKPAKTVKSKPTKPTKPTKTTPTKAKPAKLTKAAPSPTKTKSQSQLKRPSAETKKKILAAASKGSGASPRKPAARKAPTKSPVKAKMPPSKPKTTAKGGLAKGVKNAGQRLVRAVKGSKK